jgi:hypothetical protein
MHSENQLGHELIVCSQVTIFNKYFISLNIGDDRMTDAYICFCLKPTVSNVVIYVPIAETLPVRTTS